jgi:nucleotide-binding universal stress UspA family protein
MYRKILLPVDFSDKNETALQLAVDLAGAGRPEGAHVHLVHVIEEVEHLDPSELEDFYRQLENRATAKLAVLVERLSEAAVKATSEVLIGKRAERIVRFAHDSEIDLILLSAHAVDREHPALAVGSISYLVAIAARCSVLLVK